MKGSRFLGSATFYSLSLVNLILTIQNIKTKCTSLLGYQGILVKKKHLWRGIKYWEQWVKGNIK